MPKTVKESRSILGSHRFYLAVPIQCYFWSCQVPLVCFLSRESQVADHHGRQITPYLPSKTFSAKAIHYKSLEACDEPYDASLWTYKQGM